MVDTNRVSFERLLVQLAAEHERVTELNRDLITRIETLQHGMEIQSHSKPELVDDIEIVAPIVRGKSSRLCYETRSEYDNDFRTEGDKIWAEHLRKSHTDKFEVKIVEENNRFALFNPFQSLVSLTSKTQRGSLSSSDQRIIEISRRQAMLRSAGVTFDASSVAINPETSHFLERWDQVAVFSLCWVAIVCPVQISMLEVKFDTLFFANCIIDVVFFLDMLLQFFVMYPKKTSFGSVLEHRPKAIARNYLTSWFLIDLLSVVPFDLVSLLSKSEELTKIKAVKIIRLVRLIKLMRIFRVSRRFFRRFESRMPISYKQWALIRFFIMLLVLIHWMANLWALTLVLVEDSENVPRWVDTFAEMEENVASKTKDTPWKKYIASVYFTSYTLTSVGYGDIGPKNIVERVVCTMMIIISGTSWAVVLGQVSGIVADLNPDEQAFRKTMDDLNVMMNERAFPQEMCQRLRSFFHSNKLAQRRLSHQQSLFAMSAGLRGEVAIQINRPWISKVSMLRNLLKQVEISSSGTFLQAFLVDICLALQPEVRAQSEIFGKPRILYILIRGLVNRPPRLHLHGAVWGTDFILLDTDLIEPSESFALTYVELTTITREAFFQLVIKYKTLCPQLVKSVRRYCCWLAVQRALLKEAKRRRKMAEAVAAPRAPEQWSDAPECEESSDSTQHGMVCC